MDSRVSSRPGRRFLTSKGTCVCIDSPYRSRYLPFSGSARKDPRGTEATRAAKSARESTLDSMTQLGGTTPAPPVRSKAGTGTSLTHSNRFLL